MKKKMRVLLTTLFATAGFLMVSMTVAAAEPKDTQQAVVEDVVGDAASAGTRSIYGYAADYTDNPNGNFTVNAPGSTTSTGHATIKTLDFGSSTIITYVSIYRPDGTLAKSNVKLTGNQEVVVSFTNAQPGNYKVAYAVNGVYTGWIHCWIY